MQRPPRSDRLLALFGAGLLLLNYPLLSLVGRIRPEGGLPPLWIGLFLAWGAIIALTALLYRPPDRGRRHD